MKKHALFILYVLSICFMLCSCSKPSAASPHIVPSSYLNGWYIDGDVVYMVCKLIIECEEDISVNINAYSAEDVGVLLENEKLTGYNEDMSSTLFELHKGFNEIIVVFVGVYGKSNQKADYNIPDKVIITEANA